MESRNYKIWLSVIDERRCGNCERKQGKLIPVNAADVELPPIHLHCRCRVRWAEAKFIGTATKNGRQGADWWLRTSKKLPPNYISEEEAKKWAGRALWAIWIRLLPGE